MNISFKKWLESHFQNFYGPAYGEPVNNGNFQARGIKSKYSATETQPLNLISRIFPDCLFLGKCKKKAKKWLTLIFF